MKTRLSLLIPVVTTAGAIALVGATGASGQAAGQATSDQRAHAMKIRIDVDGATITGMLEDNATGRDFASLLPLTVTLEDYNGNEKVTYLSKKLSTEGAPAGFRSFGWRHHLLCSLGQPGHLLPGFQVFERTYQARRN